MKLETREYEAVPLNEFRRDKLLCVRNGKNKRIVHPSYIVGEPGKYGKSGNGIFSVPKWHTESLCRNFRADYIGYKHRGHEIGYFTEEEILEADEICENCKQKLQ